MLIPINKIGQDSKNKEAFYEKFGFVKRTEADLGYGMIYKGIKDFENGNICSLGEAYLEVQEVL